MVKMKKRVAVVLLFALCLAQIPVAPKAKTKKVKLNLTKVSLLQGDRKSTRLNSSHRSQSRMPSSA